MWKAGQHGSQGSPPARLRPSQNQRQRGLLQVFSAGLGAELPATEPQREGPALGSPWSPVQGSFHQPSCQTGSLHHTAVSLCSRPPGTPKAPIQVCTLVVYSLAYILQLNIWKKLKVPYVRAGHLLNLYSKQIGGSMSCSRWTVRLKEEEKLVFHHVVPFISRHGYEYQPHSQWDYRDSYGYYDYYGGQHGRQGTVMQNNPCWENQQRPAQKHDICWSLLVFPAGNSMRRRSLC